MESNREVIVLEKSIADIILRRSVNYYNNFIILDKDGSYPIEEYLEIFKAKLETKCAVFRLVHMYFFNEYSVECDFNQENLQSVNSYEDYLSYLKKYLYVVFADA